jgi:predicted nucleic acid-binding protein
VAIAALHRLLTNREPIYFSPQVVAEFWNVATRPMAANGLGLDWIRAKTEVARMETVLTLLLDSPVIYDEWKRLVTDYRISGVKVHDARLVATMMVHGVRQLVTFNGADFVRFAEIRVIHPREIVAAAL